MVILRYLKEEITGHTCFPRNRRSFTGCLSKLGFSQGINELPTDIAGKTDSFRPGKSFSSHMLSRTGNKTDFDALRGYDDYIESMSNVIFHTDNIRNLRALEDAIRYHTAPDSIQKEISKIQKNKNLTLDEKRVQRCEVCGTG